MTAGAGTDGVNASVIPEPGVEPAIDPEIAAAEKALADAKASRPNVATVPDDGKPLDDPWWKPGDAFVMSAMVLLFGAAVIGIAAKFARGATLEGYIRLFGTIMIITMAGFLVVSGYDDQQIAAPLGLLGTIAGYLLAKSEDQSSVAPAGATTDDMSPPA